MIGCGAFLKKIQRSLVAVNAPEFRWSKKKNNKLKVLRTRSVTVLNGHIEHRFKSNTLLSY